MKKSISILSVLLLAAPVSLWAQSGGAAKGQAAASPVNAAPKANSSQLEGKGVPYPKNKTAKRPVSNKPVPPSSVGTEPDPAARAEGKISQGAHGVQRDQRADFKATKKPGSQSKGKQ
ncbi:hypothetical protein GCM10028805_00600 [Spirosoma harenae]